MTIYKVNLCEVIYYTADVEAETPEDAYSIVVDHPDIWDEYESQIQILGTIQLQ